MPDQEMVQTTKPRLERSGISRVVEISVSILLFGVILFGLAGRLDWWEGWAFMLIFVLMTMVGFFWAILNKPEWFFSLMNERGRSRENAESWDRAIIVAYTILFFAIFITAGLDARFAWSVVPLVLKALGAIVLFLSITMQFWVFYDNPYASGVVRIQQERGQVTVSSGPYRYVRHPQYLGMLLMWLGSSLLLDSWWALIPSFFCLIVFIIRIGLEEKTLSAGLPGYIAYTQKVSYRLIPGIW